MTDKNEPNERFFDAKEKRFYLRLLIVFGCIVIGGVILINVYHDVTCVGWDC